MCLNFQMMTLGKYLTKNFEIFFRGYPHFGPSKCGVSENDHTSTAYAPAFLLRKFGCLQKNRAQTVKILPRYKGLKLKKNHFQKFSFFALQTKKRRKSAGFQDFSEIFIYMVSNYPLVLYMWFNIDTGNYQDPKTRVTKG